MDSKECGIFLREVEQVGVHTHLVKKFLVSSPHIAGSPFFNRLHAIFPQSRSEATISLSR